MTTSTATGESHPAKTTLRLATAARATWTVTFARRRYRACRMQSCTSRAIRCSTPDPRSIPLAEARRTLSAARQREDHLEREPELGVHRTTAVRALNRAQPHGAVVRGVPA